MNEQNRIANLTNREFRAEFGADIAAAQAAIDRAPRWSDPASWAALWQLRDRLEPGWREATNRPSPPAFGWWERRNRAQREATP